MKKLIKISFIGIFILLLAIPKQVNAIVNPTKEFYVNDYANILSEKTKNYILEKSVALQKATKAQIVVVTIPSLYGENLEEYATELFRKFGIGDKEENNGLLLLLTLEERQFRIEVGYGLEGVLPDGLTGRYQDEYIIPYLKEDKWDEGIINGYNAFYKKIAESYNLEVSDIQVNSPSGNVGNDAYVLPLILVFLFVGILWGATVLKGIGKKTKGAIFEKIFLGVILFGVNAIVVMLCLNLCQIALYPGIIVEAIAAVLASGSSNIYSGSGRGGYRGGGFG